MEIISTDITSIHSQGLQFLQDESGAILHQSTSPSHFYKSSYGKDSINMDRGGVGQIQTLNSNYGCVFDGITAGGVVNAYAAQAFANFCLAQIPEIMMSLNEPAIINEKLIQMLEQACHFSNNPKDHNAEGGSATGVLSTLFRMDDYLQLLGVWIGDSSCMVMDKDGNLTLLTSHQRRTDSAKDTGGQLSMCMGISGTIKAFQYPVKEDDFIILCTDGLTDNLNASCLSEIVPYICSSTVFDQPVMISCQVNNPDVFDSPRLPTVADIEALEHEVEGAHREDLKNVPCKQMCQRLFHYVKWVTQHIHDREETYYQLLFQHQQMLQSGTHSPQDESIKEIEVRLETLLRERRKRKIPGKTDDCMIVVFQPAPSHHKASF